jgi:hypothetical protein
LNGSRKIEIEKTNPKNPLLWWEGRCEKIGPLAKGGQGCRKSFTAIPLHVNY